MEFVQHLFGGSLQPGITEIWGDPDAGKSTLAFQSTALLPSPRILFFDLDNKASPLLMKAAPSDADILVCSLRDPVEINQAIADILPYVSCVIVDSFSGLQESAPGHHWQSLLLYTLHHQSKVHKVPVIVVNQYRYRQDAQQTLPTGASDKARRLFVRRIRLLHKKDGVSVVAESLDVNGRETCRATLCMGPMGLWPVEFSAVVERKSLLERHK